MRTLLSAVVVAVLSFAPALPQTPAPLTGRIVTSTGRDVKPVRRAQVTLTGGSLTSPRVSDTDAPARFGPTGFQRGTTRWQSRSPGS